MVKAYSRGWEIYYDGKNWRYVDNDEIENDFRPCKRCGRMPTKEGYDACLGHIEGGGNFCLLWTRSGKEIYKVLKSRILFLTFFLFCGIIFI